jgi:hypothetical protein
MKHFKKILISLVIACTACATFFITACGNDNSDSLKLGSGTASSYIAKNTGTEVIFTATTDVLKEDDSYSLYDYMCALYKKKQLAFDGYTGSYGYYITQVNGVAEQTNATNGYYWAVYISFTTLDDVSYASSDTTHDYGGATLYYASYGIDGIPYVNGATYGLIYSYWSN